MICHPTELHFAASQLLAWSAVKTAPGGPHPTLVELRDRGAQIKLSTKSFNVEAAKVLGLGIDNVRGSLVDADLSDIIAGTTNPAMPLLPAVAPTKDDTAWSMCMIDRLSVRTTTAVEAHKQVTAT